MARTIGQTLLHGVEAIGCSDIYVFVVCVIYSPPCLPGTALPIPPCRYLCEHALEDCKRRRLDYQLDWPQETFRCEQLPDVDDSEAPCLDFDRGNYVLPQSLNNNCPQYYKEPDPNYFGENYDYDYDMSNETSSDYEDEDGYDSDRTSSTPLQKAGSPNLETNINTATDSLNTVNSVDETSNSVYETISSSNETTNSEDETNHSVDETSNSTDETINLEKYNDLDKTGNSILEYTNKELEFESTTTVIRNTNTFTDASTKTLVENDDDEDVGFYEGSADFNDLYFASERRASSTTPSASYPRTILVPTIRPLTSIASHTITNTGAKSTMATKPFSEATLPEHIPTVPPPDHPLVIHFAPAVTTMVPISTSPPNTVREISEGW